MKSTQALSDPVEVAIIASDRHDAMRLTRTAARAIRTATIATVPMMSSMTDPSSAENEFHAVRPWRGAGSARTRLARAVATQRGPTEWRSLTRRLLRGRAFIGSPLE